MAYYDPNDDENPLDPNAPQPNQLGPQSGVISGQGSAATNQASSSPAPKTPDNPGNFVGIQQYLAQNKPQSAKLAQNVGEYVTGQGEGAKQALAQGQSDFEKEVGENRVDLNQNLFETAKNTPEQVAGDAGKKAEFQKMRDASYGGPTSLESSDYYQPINMSIQNALGTANKTSSAEGRSSLLADIQREKNEKVSRGTANLDAALLSASPDSRTILGQARENIAPIQDQLKAVTEAENMKAQQAAAETEKTRKMIQDAFSGPTGVQGKLESDLASRANQAKSDLGGQTKSVIDALQKGDPNLTDDQLKLLGINRNQYLGLLNDQSWYKQRGINSNLGNLASFATAQSPDTLISAQNIATPEDYARYQALNELMGTQSGFLNDPTQAGKAKTDAIDFNFDATPNALADRINEIKIPPQRDGMNPTSWKELNNTWNMDTKPTNPAYLALDVAQAYAQRAANFNKPAEKLFQQDVMQFTNMSSAMNSALAEINKAYGTNLEVPQSYRDKSMKLIQDNLQQQYNARSSPYKAWPDQHAINTASNIVATATFLNDLSKDASKVRGGGATSTPQGYQGPNMPIIAPPPGQFWL